MAVLRLATLYIQWSLVPDSAGVGDRGRACTASQWAAKCMHPMQAFIRRVTKHGHHAVDATAKVRGCMGCDGPSGARRGAPGRLVFACMHQTGPFPRRSSPSWARPHLERRPRLASTLSYSLSLHSSLLTPFPQVLPIMDAAALGERSLLYGLVKAGVPSSWYGTPVARAIIQVCGPKE